MDAENKYNNWFLRWSLSIIIYSLVFSSYCSFLTEFKYFKIIFRGIRQLREWTPDDSSGTASVVAPVAFCFYSQQAWEFPVGQHTSSLSNISPAHLSFLLISSTEYMTVIPGYNISIGFASCFKYSQNVDIQPFHFLFYIF